MSATYDLISATVSGNAASSRLRSSIRFVVDVMTTVLQALASRLPGRGAQAHMVSVSSTDSEARPVRDGPTRRINGQLTERLRSRSRPRHRSL